jgi:hypothetical protein
MISLAVARGLNTNRNIKKKNKKFKKHVQHKPYTMSDNTQYCWKHYITYPYCQPVFPISAFIFKYKKKSIGSTIKVSNFTSWHASEKV